MTWTISLSGASAPDMQEALDWPIFTATVTYAEGQKSYSQTFAEAQTLEQAYRFMCNWLEHCKDEAIPTSPEAIER